MHRSILFLAVLMLAGCAAHLPIDRNDISTTLASRTGHSLAPVKADSTSQLPAGVLIADGISEDEAVALALWNNAQFQADLGELGFARADLIEAGMLRNPILSLLFPVGPKQFEATLSLPIEILWQRPNRVAAARLDAERVAEQLVLHGLDLARDAMVAHADFTLALAHKQLADENAFLQQQIADIAGTRLRVGEISELEASASQLEAVRAREAAVYRTQEAETARARFATLLGFEPHDASLTPVVTAAWQPFSASLNELSNAAYASRPDLRAAELAVEAAGKQLGLERANILNLTAVLDVNGSGKEGFEMGPGMQIELPFLNQNNGKTARAKAQLQQAAQQYLATKQRIALEVTEASSVYRASNQAFELCHTQWAPEAKKAAERAQKAFAVGEVSYLFVLEINRQLLDAHVREAVAQANVHRAAAQLKRSIGFYAERVEN